MCFKELSSMSNNETTYTCAINREQMRKSRSNQAHEGAKRARENAFLVREIEELKRELKAVRGCKVPRRLTRKVCLAVIDDRNLPNLVLKMRNFSPALLKALLKMFDRLQYSAKRRRLGCANPASWLPSPRRRVHATSSSPFSRVLYMTRADRKSQVRQCLGFCSGDS